MIHDAQVEVTCDANDGNCPEGECIGLTYRLGGYDDSDTEIEHKLVQHGWIVKDGKHYCCQEHVQ